MSLIKGIKEELNKTETLNGALAFKTTNVEVLNLFSLGGSLRWADEDQVRKLIGLALAENLELGLRTVLHLSDIREGQGERRFFKIALSVLNDNYPKNVVESVIDKIPELTRWDYAFEFIGTKYENYVLNKIKTEVQNSKESNLIFKWLPSIQRNPKLAKKIANKLGLNNKEYRQMLSSERKKLNLVETNLSSKAYNKIDYSKVPSKANLLYRNAFYRKDKERFTNFLESVRSGKSKINAGTIYPHEIINKVRYSYGEDIESLDALWNNLKDYVGDESRKVIPVVDVSGSMKRSLSDKTNVTCLDASIGLGMYLAERNEGPFKDHFITFSSEPSLEKILGNNIQEKVEYLERANWNMTTNFLAVFDLILKVAKENKLKQDELPKTIVVFSDMEFDRARKDGYTPHQEARTLYEEAGYEMPELVYWNLQAKTKQFPVKSNEEGVALVSGYSPITLKYVLSGKLVSPEELMLEVIMNERYNLPGIFLDK